MSSVETPRHGPAEVDRTEARLGHNTISAAEVILSGLVQIAPASSLILVTSLVAGLAGEAIPLLFLFGAIGILATGNALAQFARIWPSAGSFVTYISRALDPRVGLAVAIVALLGYVIAFAGIYLFVGQFIVEEVFHSSGSDGLMTLVALGYGLVILIPVIVGVQVGLRLAILMYLVEVTVIAGIVVAILVQGGDHGLSLKPFSLSETNLHDFASALAITILGYVGFEAPAPLAEESENPRRNVPLAIVIGILVSGLIFVAGSYAGIVAFPNAEAFANDASPFTTAASNFAGPLGSVITVLFLTSVSASFIVANTETSRVIFNGAREKVWPGWIAQIHPRFKTPWIAALVFTVPSLLLAALTVLLTNWEFGTASGFLSTYGTLGIVLMYLMTNVALIGLWLRERAKGVVRSPLTWLAVPILGAAVMLVPFWSSFQAGQEEPFNLMPWFFGGLLVIGTVYAAVLQVRRPDLARSAGSLIMGEADPVGDALQEELNR